MAVPYFLGLMIKTQEINNKITYSKTKWSNNLYLLALIIGSLEAIYYIFETFSFINDAPTIVIVIAQMRVFLLFVLSVIFKTDRFTFQKLLALALGCIAVVGVYFS